MEMDNIFIFLTGLEMHICCNMVKVSINRIISDTCPLIVPDHIFSDGECFTLALLPWNIMYQFQIFPDINDLCVIVKLQWCKEDTLRQSLLTVDFCSASWAALQCYLQHTLLSEGIHSNNKISRLGHSMQYIQLIKTEISQCQSNLFIYININSHGPCLIQGDRETNLLPPSQSCHILCLG